MFSDECIFCKIVTGQLPSYKIYEDEKVFAFLDIGPLSQGHTLVVPKAHFEKFHECPAELLADVAKVLGEVAKAVLKATGAQGYNVLCNNGRVAGQLVDHVHFHIIPRNEGDGVFTQWPAKKYEDGQAEEILKTIVDNLNCG